MNYSRAKLEAINELSESLNKEKRISFLDFSNTIITLFTSIFSGLVFLGLSVTEFLTYQRNLYISSTIISVIIVTLALTVKFTLWVIDRNTYDEVKNKVPEYISPESSNVLTFGGNKWLNNIVDRLAFFIYILIIINMLVLSAFSISLLD